MRAVPVDSVERLVEAEWANVRLDAHYGALLQELVEEDLNRSRPLALRMSSEFKGSFSANGSNGRSFWRRITQAQSPSTCSRSSRSR